jgi:hypothetical protein
MALILHVLFILGLVLGYLSPLLPQTCLIPPEDLAKDFVHCFVSHADAYVKGYIQENYFAAQLASVPPDEVPERMEELILQEPVI